MATTPIVKVINGVTTAIQAFCGLVSKDLDPVGQSWSTGYTVLQTFDAGYHSMLVPEMSSNPGKVGNVSGVIVYMFDDGTEVLDENTGAGPQYRSRQSIIEFLMGNDAQAATNNGKTIQKIELRVRNVAGGAESQDIGAFRIRATAYARCSGAAL